MTSSLEHLLIAPVILPLVAAMLMLLLGDPAWGSHVTREHRRDTRQPRRRTSAAAAGGRSGASAANDWRCTSPPNWEAPFGIVLVADRLTALMLVLTSAVALSSAIYAMASWGRAGVYFHPLFQIQLMGLNGAFLTGDLFNLFVFFEVAWRPHTGCSCTARERRE